MLLVGEVVKPSGKGRTATWEGMVGTVTRIDGASVFVQWHNCAVEDELAATTPFANADLYIDRLGSEAISLIRSRSMFTV